MSDEEKDEKDFNRKCIGRADMQITVHFHSYFRGLIGSAQLRETVAEGSTIGDLLGQLTSRFPELGAMRNSTLIAVGVEYQHRGYQLQEGDEVSLFPPVQGG